MSLENKDAHLRSRAHVVSSTINPTQIDNDTLFHLVNVKRLKANDLVTLCDGKGLVQQARLIELDQVLTKRRNTSKIDRFQLVLEGAPIFHVDLRTDLELVLSVIDPERLDRALAGLTELGVSKITLVHPRRSKSLGGALQSGRLSLERLIRIVNDSAGQCRAVYTPTLGFEDFSEVLERVVVCDPLGADAQERPRAILIGPEGGFEEDEIPSNVPRIRLPGNVLRAETAAVVAAALFVQV